MSKILSPEDYKGTRIFKSLVPGSSNHCRKDISIGGFEDARRAIVDNFSKGLIDPELKDSAMAQLDDIIAKSQGEGSRGGHVIGHTRQGKPVYSDGKHADYEKFHEDDHYQASYHHQRAGETASMEKNAHEQLAYAAKSKGDKEAEKHHTGKAKESHEKWLHHQGHAQYHREEAEPQRKEQAAAISKKVAEIRKK
jgi:hypothetical protein